ncbi:PepSY domain-containing protein [Ochrobactrum cytisi]|nr:PepSY domain-containing protein [Brucella cytisi]
MNQIVAKVEGNSYKVHKTEIDDGLYEISAVDANGMRVEAEFNPMTGEPVRNWHHDD